MAAQIILLSLATIKPILREEKFFFTKWNHTWVREEEGKLSTSLKKREPLFLPQRSNGEKLASFCFFILPGPLGLSAKFVIQKKHF